LPPSVLIVSPYAAASNNGNWRTAERWARLLRPERSAIVRTGSDALQPADVLIALHARRSHAAVKMWHAQAPRHPCIVTLTGTDLYRDLPAGDAHALESLQLADRLIVLQERALQALPERFRSKARVIYQSAPPLAAFRKSGRVLRVLFVGHLRPEKDPLTFVRAAAVLAARRDIGFAIAGGMRDLALEQPLKQALAAASRVSLLGAISHAAARERIRRAHVLVVPSHMEGGANVVVEALTAGTAVLLSDCDGNVGMLGSRYPGYFPVGDAAELARLIARCRDEPTFLGSLEQACRDRMPLFSPDCERRSLSALLDELPAPAPLEDSRAAASGG
jgi:putative glycosyltransferase (TIGR04348 family)